MSIGQTRGFIPTWSLGWVKKPTKHKVRCVEIPSGSVETPRKLSRARESLSLLALEMSPRALWGSLRAYDTFSSAWASNAQSDLHQRKQRGVLQLSKLCNKGQFSHLTLQDLPLIGSKLVCSLQMEMIHYLCLCRPATTHPKPHLLPWGMQTWPQQSTRAVLKDVRNDAMSSSVRYRERVQPEYKKWPFNHRTSDNFMSGFLVCIPGSVVAWTGLRKLDKNNKIEIHLNGKTSQLFCTKWKWELEKLRENINNLSNSRGF